MRDRQPELGAGIDGVAAMSVQASTGSAAMHYLALHASLCGMTAEISAQLRKGVVEYCILGLLAREPMYGWQLAEELSTPGVIAGIGTLYPVLTRLREGGLITAFEKDSGVGPVRKYYRLTPIGTQRLEVFREQWPDFISTVSALIGKDDDVEH